MRASIVIGAVFIAIPVGAQQAPEPDGEAAAQLDSLELVFEREVFNYPLFERRNPFRPLGADEASGPRFEDLVFLGAILSPAPGQSIALIGARIPGATSGQPTARTYRLRMNDVLGNVRVLDIRTDAVIVEVEDFGVTETRTLERRREAPPAPPQQADDEPPTDESPEEPVEATPQDAPGDTTSDSGSDSGGQARNDDANGNRPLGGTLAAHAENVNGGRS